MSGLKFKISYLILSPVGLAFPVLLQDEITNTNNAAAVPASSVFIVPILQSLLTTRIFLIIYNYANIEFGTARTINYTP